MSNGWTCPIVFCLNPKPHEHECCEACGAMEYLNIACADCRAHWDALAPKFAGTRKVFADFQDGFAEAAGRAIRIEQERF